MHSQEAYESPMSSAIMQIQIKNTVKSFYTHTNMMDNVDKDIPKKQLELSHTTGEDLTVFYKKTFTI